MWPNSDSAASDQCQLDTHSAPAVLSFDHCSGLLKSSVAAFAKSFGDSEVKIPVSPSLIESLRPGTSQATAGTPSTAASATTIPQPSRIDVTKRRSARSMSDTFTSSSTQPQTRNSELSCSRIWSMR